MDDQTPDYEKASQTSGNQEKSDNKNTIIIILTVALAVALIGIGFLMLFYVFGDSEATEPGDGAELVPPIVTVDATLVPPTPEPGDPLARVTARAGVNVRTGPGLEYQVIGLAPFGAELEVVGVSQDGTWWVVNVPASLNNQGWVSDEFVQVENGDNIMAVPAPPTPTPVASPMPTTTPAPEIDFSASRTTINAGESATLSWSVENIVAVYVYPVGDRFENYPVTGQGSRDVFPYITTSYELLTFNPDDSTSSERIEITVVNGLTTGRWLLDSYTTPGSGFKTPLPGTEISARFGADGSLSGSAGCNSYTGGFIAFDQTLRTSNLTSSKVLCPDPEGVMEQEGTFLTLLAQASKMRISSGQLEVFDSSDNRILVFING
jgi:heat shock protein HslJ/uncharacterized protein YgiM (DUF1202 family)